MILVILLREAELVRGLVQGSSVSKGCPNGLSRLAFDDSISAHTSEQLLAEDVSRISL